GVTAAVGATSTFLGGTTVTVGDTNVNIHSVTVTGPSAFIAGINGTGSLAIGDAAHPTTLRLYPNSGASSQSSLTISPGSALNIINNHFFLNYGSGPDPILSIAAMIKSGWNNGAWNGVGINSSAAAQNNAAPANTPYGIGYADSADPNNPAGLA